MRGWRLRRPRTGSTGHRLDNQNFSSPRLRPLLLQGVDVVRHAMRGGFGLILLVGVLMTVGCLGTEPLPKASLTVTAQTAIDVSCDGSSSAGACHQLTVNVQNPSQSRLDLRDGWELTDESDQYAPILQKRGAELAPASSNATITLLSESNSEIQLAEIIFRPGVEWQTSTADVPPYQIRAYTPSLNLSVRSAVANNHSCNRNEDGACHTINVNLTNSYDRSLPVDADDWTGTLSDGSEWEAAGVAGPDEAPPNETSFFNVVFDFENNQNRSFRTITFKPDSKPKGVTSSVPSYR